MNFCTIHFNIRITLYWAPPTLYTCIVLSDIRSNWVNRMLCVVYKMHELYNNQSVKRHETQTQIGLSTTYSLFVKAVWYWKTVSLNSSYFTSYYCIWIIWIKIIDQIKMTDQIHCNISVSIYLNITAYQILSRFSYFAVSQWHISITPSK